ncbi:acyl-CoA dehydrogenase family protein [Corynebacterium sp. 153RC1]|uniref:acyl-CoA dehydrogenase family protein n=1 Tax=unclassified Corynebacterium TaxID=2624378 RepID=UPI00211C2680|nr:MULTISPECIES: acyl-CoA dehydrogenase family protein [unclassified Corynebacterium]MCQ9353288.1 acyl-CoA dehydrogenase family protein [Corynebacterium sp. 209RC1]MCQ9355428.1 acyl-CoA dehydrogenase family protein [Corynebacterium sp. 1222RC1]MCQ9357651.1 acyl-CoA dehydrogenase family protein [Corynebacterium sp. 122RC1]MCQ9359796.1 acyl-CoA dehydrogenase family protein [Corynebacterium sp. 142RC1]MCQ9361929.1 acyl-CoA dehydrogenase family protein [Corynebacterium sp. 153RC1]
MSAQHQSTDYQDFIPNSDFFGLDQDLSPEDIALRDRVREFGENTILPIINDYWERAEFPEEILPGLAELGIIGTFIQGYGCPGMSRLQAGLVAREMSRIDGSINTFLGVHSNLCMGSIYILGSEEQRQRWLPHMAKLEKTGAFALTEPNHGSDSVSLETSARREGDHWVLNGHKRWIGNGHAGDVIVVYARDEEDGQVKAFVVEKQEDGTYPTGYNPTPITGKIGKRAILQGDIIIENLHVPAENRLENCNSFKDVNKVLAATRGGASWEAVGHAIAGFELACKYALNRVQFGAPIASYQLVQEKLATMLSDVTQLQLLTRRMAELQENGTFTGAQSSMVKMTTSRKALAICREARDMMGGNGLLLENHVARHLTDMEVVSTYEGTDSIQALIVGREITGISAFTHVKR